MATWPSTTTLCLLLRSADCCLSVNRKTPTPDVLEQRVRRDIVHAKCARRRSEAEFQAEVDSLCPEAGAVELECGALGDCARRGGWQKGGIDGEVDLITSTRDLAPVEEGVARVN